MLTSGIVLRYLGAIFNKKYGNIVKHYLDYIFWNYGNRDERPVDKVNAISDCFSVLYFSFLNMYPSIPIKNTSKADISSRLLSYAKKNLSIVRV